MKEKLNFLGVFTTLMMVSLNGLLLVLGTETYDFFGYFQIPQWVVLVYNLLLLSFFIYRRFHYISNSKAKEDVNRL